jgi:hypothetical protein
LKLHFQNALHTNTLSYNNDPRTDDVVFRYCFACPGYLLVPQDVWDGIRAGADIIVGTTVLGSKYYPQGSTVGRQEVSSLFRGLG